MSKSLFIRNRPSLQKLYEQTTFLAQHQPQPQTQTQTQTQQLSSSFPKRFRPICRFHECKILGKAQPNSLASFFPSISLKKHQLVLYAMSIELKLSRSNRIYRPSDTLEGKIITKFPSPVSHQGIRITVTGDVNLQVRGGSAGVIESFVGAVKPLRIMKESIEVRSPGKLSSGTTEIPFSIILREGKDGFEKFYETFHGENISIQYLVTTDLMRGYLHKSLSATVEFLVESKKTNLLKAPVSPEMVSFYITQDTQRHPLLPELFSGGFRVAGKIITQCSLSDPLSGELTVEASAVPINSIDIHIQRVESILVGEKIVSESSLIQTTQIADGDVCRNMTLPIHVILPRLLTCPTVGAGLFAIEFQASVAISFQSELAKLHPKSDPRVPRLWLAMETVPLRLYRTK